MTIRVRFGAFFIAALCSVLLIACGGGAYLEPHSSANGATSSAQAIPTDTVLAILLSPTATASTATPAQGVGEPLDTPTPVEVERPTPPDAPRVVVTPAAPSAEPSGAVRIYETSVTLPTYPRERYQTDALDPVFNWPYKKFDMVRFKQDAPPPALRNYQLLALENDFLQIMIMPGLGGRIWQVIDKTTGRNVFYQNTVIKPTAWGPESQGGWLAAGGVEWGVPVVEHGYDWGATWGYIPLEFAPDHAAVSVFTPRDGRRLNASVTISLKAHEASFTIEPSLTNEGDQPLRFDFWHSAMLPASESLRFLLPADEMIVHSTGDPALPLPGQRMTWPLYRKIDWSRLRNWRQYAGLFESPRAQGPAVAVYDEAVDAGVVRVFPSEVAQGSKIFSPGWQQPLDSALYTDDGSSYVEIHGGLAPTFAQQSFLPPNQALSWREMWYPVHGIGNVGAVSAVGALGSRRVAAGVEIGLYVPQAQEGWLALFADGEELERRPMRLRPGEAYREIWSSGNSAAESLIVIFYDVAGERMLEVVVE